MVSFIVCTIQQIQNIDELTLVLHGLECRWSGWNQRRLWCRKGASMER